MPIFSNSYGFTLLEMLVTLSIAAILTAIAIPQYDQYKRRGYDAVALAALRDAALAEEAYFLDAEIYLSCQNEECTELPGIVAVDERLSLELVAEDTSFTGSVSHARGSGKIYRWDSELGGLQNRP